MKYWNDIVTATKYKLGINLNDADDDEYEKQMPFYANECLTMIANDIRACLKELSIVVTEKNTHVIMPEDFLSFSGISMLYDDGKTYEYHPTVEYRNWNELILPKIGTYKITYNALYGEIPIDMFNFKGSAYVDFDLTKSYTEAEYNTHFGITGGSETEIIFNGISQSVINLLPTYIASKLSEQDDIRTSTILMNQFEVMAQRLEKDERYEVEHFKSEGGWY